MPTLPVDPITIIVGVLALISLLLYLREYNLRSNLQKEGQKILEDFRQKGLETFHQSIQKSQDILGQAELEGVKVVADTKFETKKLEDQYSEKLEQVINESKQTITTSQARLIQFMADLQKRSVDFETASRTSTEQRIQALFERLENKLSDFLIQTEQKTASSIELELKSTRQLIETYKTQQLKLIDENVIAMMEQTLNIVLAKKLSLKDQLDLIYEALEKAKVEKFIV